MIIYPNGQLGVNLEDNEGVPDADVTIATPCLLSHRKERPKIVPFQDRLTNQIKLPDYYLIHSKGSRQGV